MTATTPTPASDVSCAQLLAEREAVATRLTPWSDAALAGVREILRRLAEPELPVTGDLFFDRQWRAAVNHWLAVAGLRAELRREAEESDPSDDPGGPGLPARSVTVARAAALVEVLLYGRGIIRLKDNRLRHPGDKKPRLRPSLAHLDTLSSDLGRLRLWAEKLLFYETHSVSVPYSPEGA